MNQPMSLLIILSSILLITTTNPLLLIIFMIIITSLISMKIYLMIFSSWVSLILLISILGGMMILFIYMASLAPNENFNKLKLYPIFIIPIFFMNFPSQEIKSQMMEMVFILKSPSLIFFMASYLFFTLIIVVFMTKINMGPLRSQYGSSTKVKSYFKNS